MKSFIIKGISGFLLFFLPTLAFSQLQPKLSNHRAYDKTGINVFETSKADTVAWDGLKVRFGAGFTQQFQNLKHENTALNNGGNSVATAEANKLYPIKSGFMTAQANLFMDVQLYDGIKLNVTSYLSSRHHNETWVKGGFIQFDKLPFKGKIWDDLMKITTIKVGHMEINYGDAHFRRSDGGQTIYNPFMDNYIMDAFTTEIGGEVIVQKNGLFGVLSVTSGMLRGNIDSVIAVPTDDNTKRNPSIILKGGYDKQINERLRIRVSGSYYTNSSSAGSGLTLYGGDRTGSNYQNVMERWVVNGAAQSSTAMYASGRLNPGFTKEVDAVMLNTFIKYSGLEFFGTYETAKGRAKTEVDSRSMNQIGLEAIYRFLPDEKLFLGARYNNVSGKAYIGSTTNQKVDRVAFGAGWFLTNNVLLKGEYVTQQYKDFPSADLRNGGKFSGYVIEAVVGF